MRFMLNGEPRLLRLVLDQGYWPDGLLTAPTDAALRRDIELAKGMGFDGARKHQKIEDPRWLFWADRLGFLVWGEMANAHKLSGPSINRTIAEWSEAVERDFNHPSVIAWVPVNESFGCRQIGDDRGSAPIAANVATAGFAAPVLSTAEDIFSAVMSVVALLLPVLVILGLAGLVAGAIGLGRRMRRKRADAPPVPPVPAPGGSAG